jgi:ribosomal protein S18 acetylase RimI-like enzyme
VTSVAAPIVRRATRGDVQEIARIAAEGWRHAYAGLISPDAIEDTLQRWYSEEVLLRRLIGPPLHVAERMRNVVGYVQHGPVGDSTHEVYAIYVDPALLGEGTGWALWQQVKREAISSGESAIELWVLAGNRLGIDWYDRQGGHVVGQRVIELGDGRHTELRYRFDLKTN